MRAPSGDTPLLPLGLALLAAAALLPSTVVHLGDSAGDRGAARPALSVAGPCPLHLEVTDAQADRLGL